MDLPQGRDILGTLCRIHLKNHYQKHVSSDAMRYVDHVDSAYRGPIRKRSLSRQVARSHREPVDKIHRSLANSFDGRGRCG